MWVYMHECGYVKAQGDISGLPCLLSSRIYQLNSGPSSLTRRAGWLALWILCLYLLHADITVRLPCLHGTCVTSRVWTQVTILHSKYFTCCCFSPDLVFCSFISNKLPMFVWICSWRSHSVHPSIRTYWCQQYVTLLLGLYDDLGPSPLFFSLSCFGKSSSCVFFL